MFKIRLVRPSGFDAQVMMMMMMVDRRKLQPSIRTHLM